MEEKKKSTKAKRKFPIGWRIVAGILALLLVAQALISGLATRSVPVAFDKGSAPEEVQMKRESLKESLSPLREAAFLRYSLEKCYRDFSNAIEKEDYEAAIPAAEELYTYVIDDRSAAPYMRQVLAQLYYMTGKFQECIGACDRVIEAGEDETAGYCFMKGLSEIQTGDYIGASETLQETLAKGYEDTLLVKVQLLTCFYNMKEYQKTSDLSKEMLDTEELTEEMQEAILYLAAVSELQTEDYETCVQHLDLLLEKTPDGTLYYFRGVAKVSLEAYEESYEDLKKALELGMEDPEFTASAEELVKVLEEAFEEAAEIVVEDAGE